MKKTKEGCVELPRARYNERIDFDAEDIDRRAEREISQAVNFDGRSERNALGSIDGNRNTAGASIISGQTFGEKLRNDTERSVSSFGGDNRRAIQHYGVANSDKDQEQQRTTTLADYEVLAMVEDTLQATELTDLPRREVEQTHIVEKGD